MALEITLPTLIAAGAVNAVNRAQLEQGAPNERSTVHHGDKLIDAAKARVAQIAPEADPLLVTTTPVQPGPNVSTGNLAAHGKATLPDGRVGSMISINPNADASYYAHELGHGVSQKTKIGKFVNDMRHKIRSNPKLGNALALALTGATPFLGAALQEGDDDLAGSIALAAAVASPTLIDEALASKNALAIMKGAGMPATIGQRGRLAGGYLSYLAPVIIAGSVGNAAGNLVDDYTAVYDL